MQKDFTFECGRCNSIYKLSNDDLGQAGAKITCPKCYAFFYLKPPSKDTKSPIIEKLAAKDGEYEENPPPPMPGEKTTEKILSDAIESLSHASIKTEKPVFSKQDIKNSNNSIETDPLAPQVPISLDEVPQNTYVENSKPMVEEIWNNEDMLNEEMKDIDSIEDQSNNKIFDMGLDEVTGNFYDPETIITQDSLSEYPEDPPETSVDRSIIWLAASSVAFMLLFFAHYNRYLTIPFMEKFQKETIEKVILDEENEEPISDNAGEKKFGFPEVESLVENDSTTTDEVTPEQIQQ